MTNPRGARLRFVAKSTLVAWAAVLVGVVDPYCFATTGDIQNTFAGGLFHFDDFGDSYHEEPTRRLNLSRVSLKPVDADSRAAVAIISSKISQSDGCIAFRAKPDLIGTDRAADRDLQEFSGDQPSAHFRTPVAGCEGTVHNLGVPILQTYAPVRGRNTDDVGEGIQSVIGADVLLTVLGTVRRSWITVGAVALLQTAVLLGIMWRSGGKVDSQRAALVEARRAAVEINERFLRRIGADLHDGPAQLIGLALLRLDGLRPVLGGEHARPEEFEKIRTLLESCLQEIREMSSGLAPPRLEGLHLQKMLELTIREHEQRTGTTVDAVIGALPADVPVLYKVSIYRFVQQALHNAYRHAGGVGQVVHAASEGSTLTIQVADAGPGFVPLRNVGSERLGLACMRDRIESLGGTFWLETHVDIGTTVGASFALDDIVKPDPTGGAAAQGPSSALSISSD